MSTSPFALLRLAASSIAAAALIAACAASGGPGWTYAPVGPTPSATGAPTGVPTGNPTGSPGQSATPGPSGSPGGTVIEIEETDDLRILRDGQPLTELAVTVGETYTFRVTNTAGFVHNFYLGPADRLQNNDVAGLPGIADFSEGTQEFTWTATTDAVGWQFACTVLGHYGPMHGDLMVEGG